MCFPQRREIYLINRLMIRFVCREKIRVSSPLLERTCHVSLISRMDSDSRICCGEACGESSSGTETCNS